MPRAVLLAVVLALAAADESVRAWQREPPKPATVKGRVTVALTGEPIRGATVQATSAGRESAVSIALRATTDEQGRFELAELPAGSYRITASRTGFVTRELGQRGPFESVEPLALRAGAVMNADFALTRGGAIVGRIFDHNAEPVADARVQALRIQVVQGRRRLAPVGTARLTDDLGVYRVYGLPPGDYYVAASIGPESLTVTSAGAATLFVNGNLAAPAGGGTSAFAPTYYPGTPRISDARRIVVTLAEEEYNVNFALTPARLVRVTGRVLDRAGEPLQARVELLPEIDGTRADTHRTVSEPDGTFALGGIAPGRYTVSVLGQAVDGRPADVAWFTIDVESQDVVDLTIVTNNGSTISGRLLTEGTRRPAMSETVIRARPIGAAAGRGEAAVTVNDGFFQLEGLSGPYALTVDRLPQGFVVRAITANGEDITDGHLELRGAEYVDVQVFLTDRLADLFGTVRTEGREAGNVSVVVFPDDPSQWTGASRSIRTARTNRNGDYAIRSLLPGRRYLAAAVEYLNDAEEQDAEFLQSIRPRATALPASSDQNRTLDLTLIRR